MACFKLMPFPHLLTLCFTAGLSTNADEAFVLLQGDLQVFENLIDVAANLIKGLLRFFLLVHNDFCWLGMNMRGLDHYWNGSFTIVSYFLSYLDEPLPLFILEDLLCLWQVVHLLFFGVQLPN